LSDHIAIKRLTASDCTLFEAVFRRIGAGNQKSINLNTDVFVDVIFPGMASISPVAETEIALPLNIYGPAGKGVYKIARKIIKKATYKNWRLNGEFIYGPPGDGARYDDIQPGDLAVMVFRGDVGPTGIDMIIVSQSEAIDSDLHRALDELFRNKSMIAVTSAQIAAAASEAAVPEDHPIFVAADDPALEAALEDAAQGGIEGIAELLENKGGRQTSASDLAKAKAKAELTGRYGEGLVNAYLAGKLAAGQIASYAWESAENAVAPFDFRTVENDGQNTLIDSKATSGAFSNVIHLSLAEIIEASREIPYRIYRIFGLDANGGNLRISDDIRPFARRLRALHEAHMPSGVRVDGYSVATGILSWGPVEIVTKPDEEGGD
jgi:hypothetical protein